MSKIDRRRLLVTTAGVAMTAAFGSSLVRPDAAAAAQASHAAGLGPPQSLDDRPYPGYDYSRANKLPAEMTGYWTKSFDVDGVIRTAKVYIPRETPIRSYYTVIAVPDGIDTARFVEACSWPAVADRREEGLFVLEPGPSGWGDFEDEFAYVEAAMAFFQSNRYFSIFGLHYLVGYSGGAPALEAWAVAHPLRVIAQVYVDSAGLRPAYLDSYGGREFDGTTDAGYTTVVFPAGFDLIRYDETVLPTWYIHPDRRSIGASLSYWKRANDTGVVPSRDRTFGTVFHQRRGSDRWMTSHAGPISQVAVQDDRFFGRRDLDADEIVRFLARYTRYENFFAYGNQLFDRADYARLGIQVRTMTVEGYLREYLVYVPRAARLLWRDEAPVLFVWPGNSQTDKVFLDATQWWKVAEEEGFILALVCEQYSSSSVSVSHRDSMTFYRQLRDVMINEYATDPTRFYSTGQSAGSQVTQTLAIAMPEYFAAVATTSFPVAPNSSGTVNMDGIAYPASGQTIPNYMIYGFGDLGSLAGTLWDDVQNGLDSWAAYHLQVNGLALSDVDTVDGRRSGWHRRFQTWTWRSKKTGIPVFKVTKNLYRSHNTIAEEEPMLWDFLKHYSREVDGAGNVVRYYSESAFRRPRDKKRL